MKKFLLSVFALFAVHTSSIYAQDNWYDKIKFSGDFRNRVEYEKDDTVKNGTDVVTRIRDKIRLRVGANANLGNDLKVGFRFATGESGNPIGGNQTMTTGFSKKNVLLDLAFVEYSPAADSSLKGLNIVIGKMIAPFYKPGGSDLLWDPDLTPEGAYASYSRNIGDKITIKGLLGGYWVEERAKAADSGMLAFGLNGIFKPTEKLNFNLGLSYSNYGNARDNPPFFDATKGFGNTTNAAVAPATTISYDSDFDLLNIGFEAEYSFDFAPVKFFVDFVNNSGAETDLDTGFLAGFTIGKINGPKTWSFTYLYRQLEADATVGIFSDSESSGGGTDVKGSKVAIEYAIYKNWIVGANIFIGDKKIETTSDSFTKIHLDMSFKF